MWFMCLIFSRFPDPLFLSLRFPSVERERANLCILSVRTRRRRFGRASLFVISVSFERESIDCTERFLLMLSFSFSDEQTIRRCRRTSSGAKRNKPTKNTERGGDHLHDFFFPGERESGRV